MPTRAVAPTESPEQAVRDANRHFYQAFAALDLERMDEVWLHEDSRIFSSTQRMKVEISSVWVRVEGDVAWVACTEHVTSTFERGFDQALVQATNIFVRRSVAENVSSGAEKGRPSAGARQAASYRWHMVAHHASPLPATQAPTLQ